MTYSFRFFRDSRKAVESHSFEELREELRAYCPANTVFRAISRGDGRYTVLRLSPYLIGPHIEGYLHISE